MARETEEVKDANTPAPRIEYQNLTWWNAWTKDRAPHEFLIGHIRNLRDKQAVRYTNMKKCISIYEWGFKASTYDSVDEQPLSEYTNADNAAAKTVNIVHSKVFKNRLVPMPQTTGGGALERKRAEDLGKALDGLYDENEVSMKEEDSGFDALICGVGFLKTYTEFGRAKCCFVPADDITKDDAEGRYRTNRSIFESKRMDRFQVLELYGGDEDWLHGDAEDRRSKILSCKSAINNGSVGTSWEQIDVHEAYHLPSGPDAGDGRMCIVIDNCTLVDIEWKRPRFRYHEMIPMPRRRSAWGLSMMHDLAANQNEYEWATRGLQKAHHKMGGSHFVAAESANIVERDIDNDKGTLITYSGNIPPQEWNPEPASQQAYAYQASLPSMMLNRWGVSNMSAKGEIPAGMVNASGKALQVIDDIEAGGLRAFHASRLRLHKSLAQGFIDEMRDILEANKPGAEDDESDGPFRYEVQYRGERNVVEMVDWNQVIMDENEFVLTVPSINALSQSPGARLQQLQERVNSGMMTVEQFKRLDGNPDIRSQDELDTSDEDIILRNLDIMVTTGKYLEPQPFDNLALYIQLAGKFYNLERIKGTPEARLQLIRNAIEDAKFLKDAAETEMMAKQAAQAPPPPGPAAPPQAGPMPAPPIAA